MHQTAVDVTGIELAPHESGAARNHARYHCAGYTYTYKYKHKQLAPKARIRYHIKVQVGICTSLQLSPYTGGGKNWRALNMVAVFAMRRHDHILESEAQVRGYIDENPPT